MSYWIALLFAKWKWQNCETLLNGRKVARLGGHTRMRRATGGWERRKRAGRAEEQSGKMGLNVDFEAKKDGSAGAL